MGRGIAYKRHQQSRFKAKAKRRWMYELLEGTLCGAREPWVPDDRALGISVNTQKPCSCVMCGNPRRYNGEPTIQERRQA